MCQSIFFFFFVHFIFHHIFNNLNRVCCVFMQTTVHMRVDNPLYLAPGHTHF